MYRLRLVLVKIALVQLFLLLFYEYEKKTGNKSIELNYRYEFLLIV